VQIIGLTRFLAADMPAAYHVAADAGAVLFVLS
jgi:hypothetical protein